MTSVLNTHNTGFGTGTGFTCGHGGNYEYRFGEGIGDGYGSGDGYGTGYGGQYLLNIKRYPFDLVQNWERWTKFILY